jgi:lipoprotein-releasing system permease protein
LTFLFAWRYFKAKKSTNAINVIAWVSVVAITLITAAFIILLSVFNGFEGLVKSLYSSFYPSLRIGPEIGKLIQVSPEQFEKLNSIKSIRAWSTIVEEKALIQNADIQTIVYLKGVDENYPRVTDVSNKLIRGKFDSGNADTARIILGAGIENALAVDVERTVFPLTIYLFRRGININVIDPYQAFSADNVIPTGTFFIQQDIDNKYAITNVGFMKRMMGLKQDEYGSIEIGLDDAENEENVKSELQKIFPKGYVVETRFEQNKSLYSVMRLEKWAIYGILTLMLIVAAFTMIGALTMLVLEKQKDIQVLKAMGADRELIQKIFLSEGFLLAGIGAVSGVILGGLICWAQVQFKLIRIQGGTFLIDHYPVKVIPADFLLVAATVTIVAVVASWFPSKKAAMQPIELKS